MMKNYLITLLLLIPYLSFGASGGPDAYGYAWKDSNEPGGPVYQWIDITTTGTLVTGLGDDNYVGPFNAGGFQYYWYFREEFWIGSNGYIAFNPSNIASGASGFPVMPNPTGVNDFMAPYMSDLNFAGTGNIGQVYVKINSDSIIVSYINVPYWDATTNFSGSNTFQIILNKADNSITYNYQSTSASPNTTGTYLSVGIENVNGQLGLTCFTNSLFGANYSIRFTYPPVVTYQAVDGGVNWNNLEGNKGIFLSAGGTPFFSKAEISNYGNVVLNNIVVDKNIAYSGGAIIQTSNSNVSSLLGGEDTVVNFTTPFQTSVTGLYSQTTIVSGIVGDLAPANNSLSSKIKVVDTTTQLINFDHSTGNPVGTGLSWSGGNGGVAVFIKPSFYPSKIHSATYHIGTNTSGVGFFAKIYNDDGPNGTVGTLIDSAYVPGVNVLTNQYNVVPFSSNHIIDSGGVYVLWYMDGVNIQISRDTLRPVSRHTYEVLNNFWSEYRDKNNEDFLIGLNVERVIDQDLEAVEFVAPVVATPTFLSTQVRVRLRNLAQGPHLGATVSYKYGNQATVTEPLGPALIGPNLTYLFNFTQLIHTSEPGGSNLCFWVEVPGDVDLSNDTICENDFWLYSVGIEEKSLDNKISLFPNPASTQINLSFSDLSGVGHYRILDLQGRVVKTAQIGLQENANIAIADFAAGLYFLEFNHEEGKSILKFVKQ